jgi:hypothetical protein
MNGIRMLIVLAFTGITADAQTKVRLALFYPEVQFDNERLTNPTDSLYVYVKEPFRQVRIYSEPDLGYETIIDLTVGEDCPVRVCKNNQCFDLFVDSQYMQVLIDPNNFKRSIALNSSLSTQWQQLLLERQGLHDALVDSLASLFNSPRHRPEIPALYQQYNQIFKATARKWIFANIGNSLGWNLLLEYPEAFDKAEIPSLINKFKTKLTGPSITTVKSRLVEYNNLGDENKSIYDLLFKP